MLFFLRIVTLHSTYERMQITDTRASVKLEPCTQIPLAMTSFFSLGERERVSDPAATCIKGRGHRQELALADSKWKKKKLASLTDSWGPVGVCLQNPVKKEGLGVCSCERTTHSPASYMRAMCAVTKPFIKRVGLMAVHRVHAVFSFLATRWRQSTAKLS